MNLDLVLDDNLIVNQELLNLDTVIALELDTFTQIFILNYRPIAGEFLERERERVGDGGVRKGWT